MQGGELPPVWQLAGHDIVFFNTEFSETDGDAIDKLSQRAVADAVRRICQGIRIDDCYLVRRFGYLAV